MSIPLTSETIHATAVASEGRAVLLLGPSGSGKSDLALRLIDRGWRLVSDDQTVLHRTADTLRASAPATIAGKLEVRGLGIVDLPHDRDVVVALAVELTHEIIRMPDDSRERSFLGVAVPLIGVDATTASAAAKVVLALRQVSAR